MISFEQSIWINRTQQEVFDYISDPCQSKDKPLTHWPGRHLGADIYFVHRLIDL